VDFLVSILSISLCHNLTVFSAVSVMPEKTIMLLVISCGSHVV